jgi:hypothetical protein
MRKQLLDITLAAFTLITAFVLGAVVDQSTAFQRCEWRVANGEFSVPLLATPNSPLATPHPQWERRMPTPPVPVLEIIGTITDAETGAPVLADVRVGNVSIAQVDRFRVILPADGTIPISATAPGYRRWSVDLTPHIRRSKHLEISIQLQKQPPDEDTAVLNGFFVWARETAAVNSRQPVADR